MAKVTHMVIVNNERGEETPISTFTLTATVEQMRENHCLYVQRLLPSGELFYAGLCKLADVFRCPDAYKNTYWRAMVNDTTIIETKVMMTGDNINELYRDLSFFIRNNHPTANMKGHQKSGTAAITCLEGPNMGKTYMTQDRCALENGISQPSLSNHLNGRKGYETIRGMRFKRGLL